MTANGASITFDDVIDLYHSLRIPYRRKAVWLLNDATIKALRKIKEQQRQLHLAAVCHGRDTGYHPEPSLLQHILAPELAAGSVPCSSAISATTGLRPGIPLLQAAQRTVCRQRQIGFPRQPSASMAC